MNDAQWEALTAAAQSGVSFDGLRLDRADGGYVIETPEEYAEAGDEDDLRDVVTEEPTATFVENWYYWTQLVDDESDDRYAYLRWLEGAERWDVPTRYEKLEDGVTREWGQLLIEIGLDDEGGRRYDLRHVADRDADRATLDVRTDPSDAREIARFADDGRYRPLKTAPTLGTGWTLSDLTGPELVHAVAFFYPATVANWHLEREDELDVTHWNDAAARQTGIYDVVDELPAPAVEWAAEACCVDSQCLKRREWEVDDDTGIEVPSGDGRFPCREPCSFLIAAAREWARLEREETRTYELELTPSERDQLDAIIDAVADGRIDEIREGDVDDGANRYRARYLRAKRFGGADEEDSEDETA